VTISTFSKSTFRIVFPFLLLLLAQNSWAQEVVPDDDEVRADSVVPDKKWTSHFQTTVISQKHSGFHSLYSGDKSLADSVEPAATSWSGTIFLGRRLWKNAAVYFNPEVAGGKGLSFATGVAGALNGETYRVGSVEPKVFIARAYLTQHFALGNSKYDYVDDDFNQVAGRVPQHRISVTLGRFAMADFFDNNSYADDPRTQFFNWSIWANGAWDYPADTRGYTQGGMIEWVNPKWAFRFASVAVPRVANSSLMQYKIPDAHSETFEFEHAISMNHRPGRIRAIASYTASKAPSYDDGLHALATNDAFTLAVIKGETENDHYGGSKFGLGLNFEQQLSDNIGVFSRLGWNDGKYVSWAFTEIDQTFNAGLSIKGTKWHRPDDNWGIAGAINGISNGHRDFLKGGGYGFIIGDGALNYGNEFILETYYSARFFQFLWMTFDYQFVNNPAYNMDRGPVHVFALRAHVEI
jgi:hypothetical protein